MIKYIIYTRPRRIYRTGTERREAAGLSEREECYATYYGTGPSAGYATTVTSVYGAFSQTPPPLMPDTIFKRALVVLIFQDVLLPSQWDSIRESRRPRPLFLAVKLDLTFR